MEGDRRRVNVPGVDPAGRIFRLEDHHFLVCRVGQDAPEQGLVGYGALLHLGGRHLLCRRRLQCGAQNHGQ